MASEHWRVTVVWLLMEMQKSMTAVQLVLKALHQRPKKKRNLKARCDFAYRGV